MLFVTEMEKLYELMLECVSDQSRRLILGKHYLLLEEQLAMDRNHKPESLKRNFECQSLKQILDYRLSPRWSSRSIYRRITNSTLITRSETTSLQLALTIILGIHERIDSR